MSLTTLVIALIVGFIGGNVANLIKPTGYSYLGNTVLGVIGSVVGGFIAELSGLFQIAESGLSVGSVITSIAGALVVCFAVGFFKNRV